MINDLCMRTYILSNLNHVYKSTQILPKYSYILLYTKCTTIICINGGGSRVMGVRPGASALRASPTTRFSLHFVVGGGRVSVAEMWPPSSPHVVGVNRVWSLGWQLEQLLSSGNSLVSFTRLWVPSPRIFWLMILECGQSPTCSLNPVYSGAGFECGARSQDCIRVMSLILLDCFMTGKSLNYQYVIRAPKE